jgi:hypothetical protein
MASGQWDDDGVILDDEPGAELVNVAPAQMTAVRVPEGDNGTIGMLVQHSQALVRDQSKLIARAKQIGGLLGADGFYRFPAGGKTIAGPSIDMAQALVQDWGATAYQVRVLRADPLASGGLRLHLRAMVADMRSLVYAEVDAVLTTSPAPGKFGRDVEQRERWNSMQIQSASSKIVRNAILRVLPKWYVQPAFDAALAIADQRALGKGPDGKPKTLAQSRAGAVEQLGKLGIAQSELERYVDQPLEMWAVPQLHALRDLFVDIDAGRVSVEAWRQSLTAPTEAMSPPKRSALGLPVPSEQAKAEAEQIKNGQQSERDAALKAGDEKAASAKGKTAEAGAK